MKCPHCEQEVPDTANVCGYCGQRLRAPAPVQPSPARPSFPRKKIPGWVWALGAGVLALFAIGAVLVVVFLLPRLEQAPVTAEPTKTPVPPTEREGESISYTVQEGDTCAGIASAFGVSVQDLIQANHLDANCRLEPGQVLVIPGDSVPPAPAPAEADLWIPRFASPPFPAGYWSEGTHSYLFLGEGGSQCQLVTDPVTFEVIRTASRFPDPIYLRATKLSTMEFGGDEFFVVHPDQATQAVISLLDGEQGFPRADAQDFLDACVFYFQADDGPWVELEIERLVEWVP